jgi:hypothetical protein
VQVVEGERIDRFGRRVGGQEGQHEPIPNRCPGQGAGPGVENGSGELLRQEVLDRSALCRFLLNVEERPGVVR